MLFICVNPGSSVLDCTVMFSDVVLISSLKKLVLVHFKAKKKLPYRGYFAASNTHMQFL